VEDDGVLTMSSSTDSPEEIRAGLGLEPLAPVDPIAAAEAVLATAQAAASAAQATEAAEAAAAVPAEPVAPAVALAPPERNTDGTFKPRKPTVVAEPPALTGAATVAETQAAEIAALKARLDAVTAAQPRPVAPVVAAPVVLTSPELTRITEARAKLVRPTPADFDFDDDRYQEARDAYTTARAELNIEEKLERKALASQPTAAQLEAQRTQQTHAATYSARLVAAKARYADYDAVVTDQVQVSPVMRAALLNPAYEQAADLAYELGKHPAEAQRIYDLDLAAFQANRAPVEAIEALGALKARIAARTRTTASTTASGTHTGATQTGPVAPAPARIARTAAPEPTGTMLGATSGALATDLAQMSDDQVKTMSQADYNRLRDRTSNTRR
jgi:hypothetical protein